MGNIFNGRWYMWELLKHGKIRKAWSRAAKKLGLKFHKSMFNAYLRMDGDVDGYTVNVSYDTWEEYKTDGSKPIYYYVKIAIDSNGKIPRDINKKHRDKERYSVRGGHIYWDNAPKYKPKKFKLFDFSSGFGSGGNKEGRHITDADEMIKKIKFMIKWGEKLAKD